MTDHEPDPLTEDDKALGQQHTPHRWYREDAVSRIVAAHRADLEAEVERLRDANSAALRHTDKLNADCVLIGARFDAEHAEVERLRGVVARVEALIPPSDPRPSVDHFAIGAWSLAEKLRAAMCADREEQG